MVVGDAVVDDIINAVIIADIHPVEIVIVIIGELFNAVYRAQPPGIQHAEARNRQQQHQQNSQYNLQYPFFHRKRLLFIHVYVWFVL